MCLKCWMSSCVCCFCLFTGGRGSLLHSFIQFWVRFSVQIQIYPSSSQRSATVLQLQIPNFSFRTQWHNQETNNPWIDPYCPLPHCFISGSPSWLGQGHWEGDHLTDHWSPWWGREELPAVVHSLPIQHWYTGVGCWNLFCLVICWVCQCSVQGCRVYSITHPSWVTVLHCDNEMIQNQNILNI